MPEPRTISPRELEVMEAWLGHDIDGAAALREHLSAETLVYSSCDCGCASIGFVSDRGPAEPGASIFGVDAEIMNEAGEPVGGMVLFVKNGRLHDVDIHSFYDEFPFPSLDRVRWSVRSVDE